MFQTHGVQVDGIDIEVIKQSPLGIEGWALRQFGADESTVSDDNDNNDLFPNDHCDEHLIEYPSAPLVVGGLGLRHLLGSDTNRLLLYILYKFHNYYF